MRYSGVNSGGVQALRAALPNSKVTFVKTVPPVSGVRAAEAPLDPSDRAVAQWIQGLGGQVRFAGDKIQSLSLARVPFTDAQLKSRAKLTGLEKLNLEATAGSG